MASDLNMCHGKMSDFVHFSHETEKFYNSLKLFNIKYF